MCETDDPLLLPVDGAPSETRSAADVTRAHLAACHFRGERPGKGAGAT